MSKGGTIPDFGTHQLPAIVNAIMPILAIMANHNGDAHYLLGQLYEKISDANNASKHFELAEKFGFSSGTDQQQSSQGSVRIPRE